MLKETFKNLLVPTKSHAEDGKQKSDHFNLDKPFIWAIIPCQSVLLYYIENISVTKNILFHILLQVQSCK
jgi:hypothetical protein